MTARDRHVFTRRDNMLLCRPAGAPWTLAICHNPGDRVPWRVYVGPLAPVNGAICNHHTTRRGAVAEFKRAVASLALA